MKFALYQGSSFVGGLIRKFTRSRYSHVALKFSDGIVFEAVGDGFKRSSSLGARHEKGTVIDIFEYATPMDRTEEAKARLFCETIENAPYDYGSVLVHFPLREAGDSDRSKWFCSEAALAASIAIGRPLQIMAPWRCQPDHIAISPLLKWKESVVI
jgi:uncharacterized protein YycO